MGIAVGTSLESARLNTKSPYDMAFWASTFVVDGSPSDYYDDGGETDGLALLSWAAGQVGVEIPNDYIKLLQLLTEEEVPIETALVTRGAILIGSTSIGIAMGLNDAITIINGRYFQVRTEASDWESAAFLQGLAY
jgi:hypothetical protein